MDERRRTIKRVLKFADITTPSCYLLCFTVFNTIWLDGMVASVGQQSHCRLAHEL
jgi:hypothetical protein